MAQRVSAIGKLLVVTRKNGTPAWLGFLSDPWKFWTYLAATGQFHLNQHVWEDFNGISRDLRYTPISQADADHLIAEGIGEVASAGVLNRLREEPSMTLKEVYEQAE